MSKISIIIVREYLTRVKKKSFIVMTLLSPVLILALMVLPIWLSELKDNEIKNIAVIDQVGKYENVLQSNETYHFENVDKPIDNLRKDKNYYAIVVISSDLISNNNGVTVYAENQVGLEFKSYISNQLSAFIENQKLSQYNIPGLKEMIEKSKTSINVKTIKWGEDGSETETSSEIALMTGLFATILIYLFIFVYGSQVMRGVVEEKNNRIIEVIISSVRPFELMIGKIIGIALVGLTQFLLWIILTAGVLFIAGNTFGLNEPQQASEIMISGQAIQQTNMIHEVLATINITQILFFFVIYFLGGYLLYASLFAAIGAASDNETDTQQFMLPITIPIIFALYAAMYSANNPDGPLAFWCSIIPFTSPIVMMVRIPLGVPAWQLALSIFILILSFIGTTWIAAKIYRTGILMYGKKVNYKEIWKWMKYK